MAIFSNIRQKKNKIFNFGSFPHNLKFFTPNMYTFFRRPSQLHWDTSSSLNIQVGDFLRITINLETLESIENK